MEPIWNQLLHISLTNKTKSQTKRKQGCIFTYSLLINGSNYYNTTSYVLHGAECKFVTTQLEHWKKDQHPSGLTDFTRSSVYVLLTNNTMYILFCK